MTKQATAHYPADATPATSASVSVFTTEILEGLHATPKTLPSKYFYDQQGDELFQQIMQLDEYYLTRAELAILNEKASELLAHFSAGAAPFNLIELGAGDGYKTKVLLKEFVSSGARFTYVPIDISGNALQGLSASISQEIPEVKISPLEMDYFQGLDLLSEQSAQRKVVLFLGSSIGNQTNQQATAFLQELCRHLSPGDLLLFGFDLVKDPARILAAYDDAAGITSRFNLNLLTRINREAGANFQLNDFRHFALYDPLGQEARSYLISQKEQQVYFPAADTTISFTAWEPIHTEISRKYTLPDTSRLAQLAGCEVLHNFIDKEQNFLDALWQKK